MSIWTSKALVLAVLGGLALSACDELAPSQTEGSAKALTQTELARGTVRLVAAEGYCIDPRSVRTRFALMGRCDTLGVAGFFNDKDLAIITVSTQSVPEGTVNPNADAQSAEGEVLSTVERDGLALVRLRGDQRRIDGVADVYWRTAFIVGDQLVSLALYAPPGSPALERDGARLLENVVRRTQRASAAAPG